jgi:tRNA U34 2-thiouridine synthase MnmA/TrmU
LNLSGEFFKNNFLSYFLHEYEQGFTPNPDILCNKYIKFPLFYEYCKRKFDDVDFIATGHYAMIDYDEKMKSIELEMNLVL